MKHLDCCYFLRMAGLGAALLHVACGNAAEERKPAETRPVPVQVVTLRSAPFDQVYETAGTVRARQRAVLASKVQGTVLTVAVKLGDVVRAGQLLVELESGELNAEVSGAQAGQVATERALNQAEKAQAAAEAEAHLAAITLQRFQQLFEKRSVSRQELDQAEARQRATQATVEMAAARVQEAQAQQEAASAALAAARIRQEYARIIAPFAGFVTERHADPGALATPGMPLLTVEDSSGYQLEVSLTESHLSAVNLGDAVRVSIPAIRIETTARIVEMEPHAEAGSRSSLVRIGLPATAGLHSGLFGRAFFSVGKSNLLAVPQEAVLRQGQLVSVFVVEEGRARRRLVTLGQVHEGAVEVLSGLSEGEQVATSGLSSLTDGAPVEIRP